MTKSKRSLSSGKAGKIIYWIFPIWLALGMVSTGIIQLTKTDGEVDNLTQLGYPVYILTLLGVWKMKGVIAVLIPKIPLLKECLPSGTSTGSMVTEGRIFHYIITDQTYLKFIG
jgi:hypothetical protein